ncbi:MAG: coenzyme F420-0:L-glutamate ligase [Congregibacter sp.]
MLSITAVEGLPEIHVGADLAALIAQHTRAQLTLGADAVLIVAQKIVSKAEDRLIALNAVEAGPEALRLAAEVNKDPRLVELILGESKSIIRKVPGLLIVEHRSGHILANAGIDTSNIPQDEDNPQVLLWPEDPDASARRLSQALEAHLGQSFPVIINDSIGRPWRYGTTGHAIGCYGLAPLWNQIGHSDRFGNVLRVTEPATADGLAAAAALVQGEAAEGLPVVWVEGCAYQRATNVNAQSLLRDQQRDLFR